MNKHLSQDFAKTKIADTNSSFRRWLAEIWRENCEEYRSYGQEPLPLEVYWNRYRWWLRAEYRRRQP